MQVRWFALLAFAHTSLGSIFPVPSNLTDTDIDDDVDEEVVAVATLASNSINGTTAVPDDGHDLVAPDARRRGRTKPRRSTSSSSGERVIDDVKISADSLGLQSYGSSSSTEEYKKKRKPTEGKGWRKWHRKCTPCPVEMAKKWRDPTIKWICGGYQRARRSFKSECMMFYRNCQDGTMFVKLQDHRCDEKAPGYNGGRHFFYDYKVLMVDDSTRESESSETSDAETSATQETKSSATE